MSDESDCSLSRTLPQADKTENGGILDSACLESPDATARPIPGYPGYVVSESGVVYSLPKRRHFSTTIILRQTKNPHGYFTVAITGNGKNTTVAVHRLVALAFYGPPPTPEHEVRHLDGSRDNNHFDNLRWGTVAENAADKVRHGRHNHGPSHGEKVRKGLLSGLSFEERSRRIKEGQKKAGAFGSERAKRLWEKRRANAAARKAVQE